MSFYIKVWSTNANAVAALSSSKPIKAGGVSGVKAQILYTATISGDFATSSAVMNDIILDADALQYRGRTVESYTQESLVSAAITLSNPNMEELSNG